MRFLEYTYPVKIRKITQALRKERALNEKAIKSINKYQFFLFLFVFIYIMIFFGSEMNIGLLLLLLAVLYGVWHTFWKLGNRFIPLYTEGMEVSGEITEYKTNTFLLFEIFDFRIKYKYQLYGKEYEDDTGTITGFLKDGANYYTGQKISIYVDPNEAEKSAPYTEKLYNLFCLKGKKAAS